MMEVRTQAAAASLLSDDGPAAELVHLGFFAGRSLDEAAALPGVSPRQADRLWAVARAWLYQQLNDP